MKTSITIAHHSKVDDSMPFGCYSDDTEVLTKAGWLLHKDWHGEEILNFDPQTERMVWAKPQHQWVYDYSGEMVHIKSPATDVLVTPNHRLVVKPAWRRSRWPKNADWRFLEAGKISHSQWKTPYSALGGSSEEDNEISDDMLRLVGWWVSEGSIGDNALQIAQAKHQAQPIADVLARLDIPFSVSEQVPKRAKDKEVMWYFRTRYSADLAAWMVDQCGSGAANKRLPSFVSSLSRRQMLILLDVLVDGDGSRKPNGRLIYTTNSPVLADDVQRLAVMAGKPAVVSKRKSNGYEVKIGTRHELTMRKARHVSREQYTGKVYCFTVPTGAYLTRRDGAIAIQGNSVFWWNSMRNIWLAKVSRDTENELHLGLFHRKINNGPLQQAQGLRISFGETSINIEREDLRDVASMLDELDSHIRIETGIRDFTRDHQRGPTREQLTEQVGSMKPGTFRSALSRLLNKKKIQFRMGVYELVYTSST